MDKNKMKSFAIWARRNLIGAVSERANRIGVTENKIEAAVAVQGGFKLEGNDEIFKLSKDNRDKLVREVNEKGFEQVMEEVAYTWFNRFMGLRYMEVNEYLPTGVRVLSSEVEGKTEPDVLTRVSEVIDELKLNSEYIYELLDSGKTEDREEAYKHILVRQCNELGKIIPQMFEKISDYTELLLPDNLLEEGSVIRKMVEDIEEEDWKEEVEIIGWMYQYYISEKKDEVFAALKKNVKITKENIPAATQLFTPKWIVKYMVENSLGRLWLEGHPNEELQKELKYYLEEAQQEPEVEEELKKIREEHSKLKPEDIKVLDPCMGSGHILVYAFDVLYEIYKTAGYSEREIPRMILQNNIYGLDIDDRAAQLASFALIMKARHYNRRLFREIEREHLELNLCSIQESNSIHKEAIDYFCSLETGLDNDDLKNELEYLWSTFTDGKEYGSILEVEEVNFESLKQRLKEIEQEENFMFGDYRKMLLDKLPMIIKQGEIMSRKYEVCVTNPPYMGRKGMNDKLINYVDNKYPNTKQDLFSMFIERCNPFVSENGLMAMITQHSWMFLSSYSNFRTKFYLTSSIINMTHLGARAFEEIGGEVVQSTSFVSRSKYIENYNGVYKRLVDYNNAKEKEEKFLVKNNKLYVFNSEKSQHLPGRLLAYWLDDVLINLFLEKKFSNYYISEGQNKTGNNDKFLRYSWEVKNENIGINEKWRYYAKGGGYRKWYGNLDSIINWSQEARTHYRKDKVCRIVPDYLTNRKGITWGLITTKKPSFRVLPSYSTFDVAGTSVFFDDYTKYNYFLGFLNSKIATELLTIINPTVSLQLINVGSLPIIFGNSEFEKHISNCVETCISIVKWDWDNQETSKDFKNNILIKNKNCNEHLDEIIQNTIVEYKEKSRNLLSAEEEINNNFIELYKLSEIMNKDIEIDEPSIYKEDYGFLIRDFVSYSIGCILGRYSIDAEGLIYAGGDFKDKWNLDEKKVRKIEKDEDGNVILDSWIDATFLPDGDNVIPITEDEYFEDDIVARFIEFVRTVYGEETLEENLDFIADSIGRKPSETARQAIRRYFIKDFYKDHLKVYQKRPIYWMFESGKNDGFKGLVYMHRYNEQTVARVRTDYLHMLQRKYEAEIQRQQLIIDSEEYTAKDRTTAKKKIDRISKQIEECREYDQVVAHLANEKISIDLDDGVKVNYEKFQGVKFINSKDKEVKMDLLASI